MLNRINDAKRREAMALVREGRLYDLSQVLDESNPVFPGRYFRQTLVTTAHHTNSAMPLGENQVNWVTEIVSGTTSTGVNQSRGAPRQLTILPVEPPIPLEMSLAEWRYRRFAA
jgi:hypothetical protein